MGKHNLSMIAFQELPLAVVVKFGFHAADIRYSAPFCFLFNKFFAINALTCSKISNLSQGAILKSVPCDSSSPCFCYMLFGA
jgi:hypothetical protein